jgi:hypothetical protein
VPGGGKDFVAAWPPAYGLMKVSISLMMQLMLSFLDKCKLDHYMGLVYCHWPYDHYHYQMASSSEAPVGAVSPTRSEL